MPLGVTTLAQFNGADGLGDDTSTTQMYVGIGSIVLLLGAMLAAGATARGLTANKRRRRKHKAKLRFHANARAMSPRRTHRKRPAARYCVHHRCRLGAAGVRQSGSHCAQCGQFTVFGHLRAR